MAAAFVFCLSSAHSLTFSALPLFYVQEVGLPGYAPGTAFSVKTLVEIFAIFTTPVIVARFGLKGPLIGVALLAAVTILLLSEVRTYPQMLAGAALEGLYYGLYASIGLTFVQSFSPDRPAQATALYWNALKVSGILAGPATGLIAQAYDFQTVIRVASAVGAGAGLLLMVSMLGKR
ncbi:MFS transporter [Falsirhodobacter deserti]|uniref:MFS transporter n=1 Tax=Falsirhodobacter deserti TaxID=1365611 RepID=UPI001F4E9341|nr:MFS transporter [Falsirhodobacter deserti]